MRNKLKTLCIVLDFFVYDKKEPKEIAKILGLSVWGIREKLRKIKKDFL